MFIEKYVIVDQSCVVKHEKIRYIDVRLSRNARINSKIVKTNFYSRKSMAILPSLQVHMFVQIPVFVASLYLPERKWVKDKTNIAMI